jgi:hypothetical protein
MGQVGAKSPICRRISVSASSRAERNTIFPSSRIPRIKTGLSSKWTSKTKSIDCWELEEVYFRGATVYSVSAGKRVQSSLLYDPKKSFSMGFVGTVANRRIMFGGKDAIS